MSAEISKPVLEALDLAEDRTVYVMGGGGKTTLMFALSRALEALGESVLTTTSTRIRVPGPENSPHVIVSPYSEELVSRLSCACKRYRRVTAAPSFADGEEKLRGFTTEQLDKLCEARVADRILVEADGSAGRSLKAHLDHEPVLSSRADLVIIVIGVDCIGVPLNDGNVHRAELFSHRLGRALETEITIEDVAAIVFHPEGYLRRIGPRSRVAIFLSKVGTLEAEETARRLAASLRAGDKAGRIGPIAMGDLAGV